MKTNIREIDTYEFKALCENNFFDDKEIIAAIPHTYERKHYPTTNQEFYSLRTFLIIYREEPSENIALREWLRSISSTKGTSPKTFLQDEFLKTIQEL